MRLNINLASQPYEDAGNFYRRWGAVLGLLALVTIALIAVGAHEWMSTRSIAKQIAGIQKQSNDLDDKKNQALVILNRPENRGTRDRAAFVNDLFAIKSFAWSQVFSDMETLMPTRVHIVSIEPKLDKESQIEVTITAAGDSRDKGIELLQNLEKSRYFRNPILRVERMENAQPGPGQSGMVDTMKFELLAYYVPQIHVPEKKREKEKKDKGQAKGPAVGSNTPAGDNRAVVAASRGNGGE